MTDREPVNIMGVIAFPNPNKDERMIRFIDSEYHTLFTIRPCGSAPQYLLLENGLRKY